MASVVGGEGLGLYNSLLGSLGASSNGQTRLGQNGNHIYVNASTGNLLVRQRDEFLSSTGLDFNLFRTYNSLGQLDADNNDNWRLSVYQSLAFIGTANTAGSKITKTYSDGSEIVFDYDAAQGHYVSTAGDGAHDTIRLQGTEWVWGNGDSSSKEIYNGSGQLVRVEDADGNTRSYSYSGSLITQITDSSGQTVNLVYSGNNLTQIDTVIGSGAGAVTQTRVYYTYDANNRLETVSVDLSPADNSTVDGDIFVTTYSYDGTSNRVAGINHSDGSSVIFTYDVSNRISTVTYGSGSEASVTRYEYEQSTQELTAAVTNPTALQTDANGASYYVVTAADLQAANPWASITQLIYGNTQSEVVEAFQRATGAPELVAGLHLAVPQPLHYSVLTAAANTTSVIDPLGHISSYVFDAAGKLTQILSPALAQGQRLSTEYFYDADDNLVKIIDGNGNVVDYSYDSMGNLLRQQDAAGNVVEYQYDAFNRIQNETVYLTPDPDGAGTQQASDPQTTRYIYDSEGHLLYTVSQNGSVTKSIYDVQGNLISTLVYSAETYDTSGLSVTDVLTSIQLDEWSSAPARDLSQLQRSDFAYDFRGNLSSQIVYGSTDALGAGVPSTAAVTYFIYDQAGQLVKSIDPRGTSNNNMDYVANNFETHYLYDGLGRLIQTTDALGHQTSTVYNDANQRIETTQANGLIQTRVYNSRGHLISFSETDPANLAAPLSESHHAYDDAGRLKASQNANGVITHRVYDAAGRRVATIDGTGALTEYIYDAEGQLIQQIEYTNLLQAATLASLVNLDAQGALQSANDIPLDIMRPQSHADDRKSYNYFDETGRLIFQIDAEGFVTENRYDGAGQLLDTIAHATAFPGFKHHNANGANITISEQVALLQWLNTTLPAGGQAQVLLASENYSLSGVNAIQVEVNQASNSGSITLVSAPEQLYDTDSLAQTNNRTVQSQAVTATNNHTVLDITGENPFAEVDGRLATTASSSAFTYRRVFGDAVSGGQDGGTPVSGVIRSANGFSIQFTSTDSSPYERMTSMQFGLYPAGTTVTSSASNTTSAPAIATGTLTSGYQNDGTMTFTTLPNGQPIPDGSYRIIWFYQDRWNTGDPFAHGPTVRYLAPSLDVTLNRVDQLVIPHGGASTLSIGHRAAGSTGAYSNVPAVNIVKSGANFIVTLPDGLPANNEYRANFITGGVNTRVSEGDFSLIAAGGSANLTASDQILSSTSGERLQGVLNSADAANPVGIWGDGNANHIYSVKAEVIPTAETAARLSQAQLDALAVPVITNTAVLNSINPSQAYDVNISSVAGGLPDGDYTIKLSTYNGLDGTGTVLQDNWLIENYRAGPVNQQTLSIPVPSELRPGDTAAFYYRKKESGTAPRDLINNPFKTLELVGDPGSARNYMTVVNGNYEINLFNLEDSTDYEFMLAVRDSSERLIGWSGFDNQQSLHALLHDGTGSISNTFNSSTVAAADSSTPLSINYQSFSDNVAVDAGTGSAIVGGTRIPGYLAADAIAKVDHMRANVFQLNADGTETQIYTDVYTLPHITAHYNGELNVTRGESLSDGRYRIEVEIVYKDRFADTVDQNGVLNTSFIHEVGYQEEQRINFTLDANGEYTYTGNLSLAAGLHISTANGQLNLRFDQLNTDLYQYRQQIIDGNGTVVGNDQGYLSSYAGNTPDIDALRAYYQRERQTPVNVSQQNITVYNEPQVPNGYQLVLGGTKTGVVYREATDQAFTLTAQNHLRPDVNIVPANNNQVGIGGIIGTDNGVQLIPIIYNAETGAEVTRRGFERFTVQTQYGLGVDSRGTEPKPGDLNRSHQNLPEASGLPAGKYFIRYQVVELVKHWKQSWRDYPVDLDYYYYTYDVTHTSPSAIHFEIGGNTGHSTVSWPAYAQPDHTVARFGYKLPHETVYTWVAVANLNSPSVTFAEGVLGTFDFKLEYYDNVNLSGAPVTRAVGQFTLAHGQTDSPLVTPFRGEKVARDTNGTSLVSTALANANASTFATIEAVVKDLATGALLNGGVPIITDARAITPYKGQVNLTKDLPLDTGRYQVTLTVKDGAGTVVPGILGANNDFILEVGPQAQQVSATEVRWSDTNRPPNSEVYFHYKLSSDSEFAAENMWIRATPYQDVQGEYYVRFPQITPDGKVLNQLPEGSYDYVVVYAEKGTRKEIESTAGHFQVQHLAADVAPVTQTSVQTFDRSQDSRQSRILYDNDGRQVGRLDAEGYLTEFVYDAAGRLVETIQYSQRSQSLFWSDGELADLRPLQLDPANDIREYTVYNDRGQRVTTVDGEGYVIEYRYDVAGNPSSTVAYANALSATAQQGLAGNAAGLSLADVLPPADSVRDQVTQFEYDANNRISVRTNAQGSITRYSYDAMGNVVRVSSGEAATGSDHNLRTVENRFDLQGNVLASLSAEGYQALQNWLDANPGATQAQIDAQTQLIWDQYATHNVYDATGQLQNSYSYSSNHGNLVTRFYYDAEGRIRYSINAQGEISERIYNSFGDVSHTIQYANRVDATALSGLTGGLLSDAVRNTLNALRDPENDSVVEQKYDHRGLAVWRQDELGHTREQFYNAFGNVQYQSETIQGGALDGVTVEVEHRYDRRGLLTNTLSNTTQGVQINRGYDYDAFGQKIAEYLYDNIAVGKTRQHYATRYDRLGNEVERFEVDTTIDPQNPIATLIDRVQYDAFGRTISQTDALGNTTAYSYNTVERSITITTAEGVSSTTRYNRQGEQVSITDGSGARTEYEYNKDGKLTKTSLYDTNNTLLSRDTNEYDSAGRLLLTTNSEGLQVRTSYDQAERVLSRVVDPSGLALTTQYVYDAKDQVIQSTDPEGTITETYYDNKGRVTQVIVDAVPAAMVGTANEANYLALTTYYSYDSRDQRIAVSVGNQQGLVNDVATGENFYQKAINHTEYEYDTHGRLVRTVVDPNVLLDGGEGVAGLHLETRYEYDTAGNQIAETNANGHTTRYIYDVFDRLIYSVNANGQVQQNHYDANGNIVALTEYRNAIAGTELQTFDAATTTADVEALIVSDALDRRSQTVYDRDGRVTHQVSAAGVVSEQHYDVAGRVALVKQYSEVLSDVATVNYTSPAQVNDALTAVRIATGDTVAEQHSWSVYDAAGRALYNIDALGYVTANTYDGNGNIIKTVEYATALPAALLDSNLLNRAEVEAKLSAASADRSTRYVYDGLGRQTFKIDALGYVTQSDYDPNGRVVKTIRYEQALGGFNDLPSQAEMQAAAVALANTQDHIHKTIYDAAGRIQASINVADNAQGVTEEFTESYTYDGAGNRLSVTNANGDTWNYLYDAANRLLEERSPEVAVTRLDSVIYQQPFDGAVNLGDSHSGDLIAATDAYRIADGRLTLQHRATGVATEYQLNRSSEYPFANHRRFEYTITLGSNINDIHLALSMANTGAGAAARAHQLVISNGTVKAVYNGGGTPIESVLNIALTANQSYVVEISSYTDKSDPANPQERSVVRMYLAGSSRSTAVKDDRATDDWGLVHSGLSFTSNGTGAVDAVHIDRIRELMPTDRAMTADHTTLSEYTSVERIITRYQYNALGDVTARIEAADTVDQRITYYDYDALGRQVMTRLPETSVYSYNADAGNPADPSNPPEQALRNGRAAELLADNLNNYVYYDAFGNAAAYRDVNDKLSFKVYDGNNRLRYEIDALGFVTEYRYDAFANNTHAIRYASDIRVQLPGLPTTDAEIQNLFLTEAQVQGWVALVADSTQDRTLTTQYDALNRATDIIQNSVLVASADPTLGNITVSNLAPATQNHYNAFGEVIKQSTTAANGQSLDVYYYFSNTGQKLGSVDSEGFVTLWKYDGEGNVTRKVEYANPVTLPADPHDFAAVLAAIDAHSLAYQAPVQPYIYTTAATVDSTSTVTENLDINVTQYFNPNITPQSSGVNNHAWTLSPDGTTLVQTDGISINASGTFPDNTPTEVKAVIYRSDGTVYDTVYTQVGQTRIVTDAEVTTIHDPVQPYALENQTTEVGFSDADSTTDIHSNNHYVAHSANLYRAGNGYDYVYAAGLPTRYTSSYGGQNWDNYAVHVFQNGRKIASYGSPTGSVHHQIANGRLPQGDYQIQIYGIWYGKQIAYDYFPYEARHFKTVNLRVGTGAQASIVSVAQSLQPTGTTMSLKYRLGSTGAFTQANLYSSGAWHQFNMGVPTAGWYEYQLEYTDSFGEVVRSSSGSFYAGIGHNASHTNTVTTHNASVSVVIGGSSLSNYTGVTDANASNINQITATVRDLAGNVISTDITDVDQIKRLVGSYNGRVNLSPTTLADGKYNIELSILAKDSTTTTDTFYYEIGQQSQVHDERYFWDPVNNWNGQINLFVGTGGMPLDTYRVDIQVRDDGGNYTTVNGVTLGMTAAPGADGDATWAAATETVHVTPATIDRPDTRETTLQWSNILSPANAVSVEFAYRVAGSAAAFTPVTVSDNGAVQSVQISGLLDGDYEYEIRYLDSAGYAVKTATGSFNVNVADVTQESSSSYTQNAAFTSTAHAKRHVHGSAIRAYLSTDPAQLVHIDYVEVEVFATGTTNQIGSSTRTYPASHINFDGTINISTDGELAQGQYDLRITQHFRDGRTPIAETIYYEVGAQARTMVAGDNAYGVDRETRYVYDQLNRKISETQVGVEVSSAATPANNGSPGSGSFSQSVQNLTSRMGYDAVGNLIKEENALGSVRYRQYDALGRVLGVTEFSRTQEQQGPGRIDAAVILHKAGTADAYLSWDKPLLPGFDIGLVSLQVSQDNWVTSQTLILSEHGAELRAAVGALSSGQYQYRLQYHRPGESVPIGQLSGQLNIMTATAAAAGNVAYQILSNGDLLSFSGAVTHIVIDGVATPYNTNAANQIDVSALQRGNYSFTAYNGSTAVLSSSFEKISGALGGQFAIQSNEIEFGARIMMSQYYQSSRKGGKWRGQNWVRLELGNIGRYSKPDVSAQVLLEFSNALGETSERWISVSPTRYVTDANGERRAIFDIGASITGSSRKPHRFYKVSAIKDVKVWNFDQAANSVRTLMLHSDGGANNQQLELINLPSSATSAKLLYRLAGSQGGFNTLDMIRGGDGFFFAGNSDIPAGEYEYKVLLNGSETALPEHQGTVVMGRGVSGQLSVSVPDQQARQLESYLQTPYTGFKVDIFGNTVAQTRYANNAAITAAADGAVQVSAPLADSSSDQTVYSQYNNFGHISQQVDGEGNSVYFAYDKAGNLAKQWSWVSDPAAPDNLLARRMAGIVNRYDALGQQIERIQLSEHLQSFDVGFDTINLSDTLVTTQMQYNAFGELSGRGIKQQGGIQEYFHYDQAGRIWRSNEKDGVDKIYFYDPQGNMIQQLRSPNKTSNNLQTLAYTQTALQGVSDLGLSQMEKTVYHYNGLGQTTGVEQPGWVQGVNTLLPTMQQQSDRWGNVIRVIDPAGTHTTYRYNHLNQMTQEVKAAADANGQGGGVKAVGVDANGKLVTNNYATPTSHFYYDALGNAVGQLDANGHASINRYNEAGELIEAVAADGGSTWSRYDNFGREVEVVKQKTADTRHSMLKAYDKNDRLLSEYGSGDIERHYQYDELGNRKQLQELYWKDAAGNKSYLNTNYVYDVRGNLLKENPQGNKFTLYRYDAQGNKTYEFKGLTTATSANRELNWAYDYFGRVVDHQDLSGADYNYAYDDLGHLVQQTSGHGQNVAYSYYENGLRKQYSDNAAGSGLIENYEYDITGRETKLTQSRAFDAVTTYSYDVLGRMTHLHADGSSANLRDGASNRAYFADVYYEYDAVGNRRHISGSEGKSTVNGISSFDLWYSYDAANRVLISQGQRQGNATSGYSVARGANGIEMQYDFLGNRTHTIRNQNGTTVTETHQYDTAGRLKQNTQNSYPGVKRSYDLSGRLLYQLTYITDSTGNVVSATPKELREYRYNSHGDMVQLIVHDYSAGLTSAQIQQLDQLIEDPMAGHPIPLTHVKTILDYHYDFAGNTLNYDMSMVTRDGMRYDYDYIYSYDYFDTAKQTQIVSSGTRTDMATSVVETLRGTVNKQAYDANGYLVKVTDEFYKPGETQRVFEYRDFLNDSQGRVVAKQNSHNFGAVVHDNTDQQNGMQFYYYNRQAGIGTGGTFGEIDFDYSYTPLTTDNLPSAPGGYIVRQGDTLESIALSVYGDSQLWYLIADANGISSSSELTVNQSLKIPSANSARNATDTFKPYNAGQIVGDTTPALPTATPVVVKSDGGGSGGFVAVILAVVAIVVTVFTAGATASALAPGVAAASGAGGTMAIGASVLAGTATGIGTAAMVTAAVVGGAVGGLASQLVGKAMGVVDKISWSSVAVSAISAGTVSYLGASGVLANAAPGSSLSSTEVMKNAAITNVVNQGISILANPEQKFSWRSLAFSTVAAGLQNKFAKTEVGKKLLGGSGKFSMRQVVANTGIRTVMRYASHHATGEEGKLRFADVAADAFGNALGDAIVAHHHAVELQSPEFKQRQIERQIKAVLEGGLKLALASLQASTAEQSQQAGPEPALVLTEDQVEVQQSIIEDYEEYLAGLAKTGEAKKGVSAAEAGSYAQWLQKEIAATEAKIDKLVFDTENDPRMQRFFNATEVMPNEPGLLDVLKDIEMVTLKFRFGSSATSVSVALLSISIHEKSVDNFQKELNKAQETAVLSGDLTQVKVLEKRIDDELKKIKDLESGLSKFTVNRELKNQDLKRQLKIKKGFDSMVEMLSRFKNIPKPLVGFEKINFVHNIGDMASVEGFANRVKWGGNQAGVFVISNMRSQTQIDDTLWHEFFGHLGAATELDELISAHRGDEGEHKIVYDVGNAGQQGVKKFRVLNNRLNVLETMFQKAAAGSKN